MRRLVSNAAIGCTIAMVISGMAQAAAVHTTDFIPDGSRTGFNGFEAIPNDGTFFTGGSGPYTEGGISVLQVNGDCCNDIWVTYRPTGSEGSYGWYPNGGDNGYTSITLSGGGDFTSVGMLVGSGFGDDTATGTYQLWDNGSMIQSGSFSNPTGFHYLGFSGGGFDTIRLSDGIEQAPGLNALTVDSIEISEISAPIPEPETYAMLLAGLGLLGFAARRRKLKEAAAA